MKDKIVLIAAAVFALAMLWFSQWVRDVLLVGAEFALVGMIFYCALQLAWLALCFFMTYVGVPVLRFILYRAVLPLCIRLDRALARLSATLARYYPPPKEPILLRPEDEAPPETLFAQIARTIREQPGYHSWRGREVLAALDHENEKKRGA